MSSTHHAPIPAINIKFGIAGTLRPQFHFVVILCPQSNIFPTTAIHHPVFYPALATG
jgi:hypothetical protein